MGEQENYLIDNSTFSTPAVSSNSRCSTKLHLLYSCNSFMHASGSNPEIMHSIFTILYPFIIQPVRKRRREKLFSPNCHRSSPSSQAPRFFVPSGSLWAFILTIISGITTVFPSCSKVILNFTAAGIYSFSSGSHSDTQSPCFSSSGIS